MLRLGITGGIGGGKSLVCGILEKMGLPVYYADEEARRLMNSNVKLKEGIIALLGPGAYRSGKLNREKVGALVFGNPSRLEKLNALVHPAVHEDFERWAATQEGSPFVVEEAALLFESGAYRRLDVNVLVYAPQEQRIERVMLRDGVSRDAVRQRIERQMDEEKKRELADEVILNDGGRLLLPQVVELHSKLVNKN